MSRNKLKELIEKLKVHAENKNDDELKKIVSSYDTTEDDSDDGEGEGGGNSPEPPDVP